MSFVHLHVHTGYSLLDGACRPADLVRRVKEQGMTAVAITDHGVMYGAMDFYKNCKKEGIKPLIGCEVYVASKSRFDKLPGDDKPHHLVLLAKDRTGYENLIKIVSKAHLEGFYYKPRVDKELLAENSEGLVCLSACLAGELPSRLLAGDYEGAKDAALWYKGIFGDDYYIELQNHGLEEQRQTNPLLARIAEETGIGLVATNDSHYLSRDDAHTQDVLLCIATGKTLNDPDRMKFETSEFYLKSEEEMRQALGEYPEAFENTVKIAEKCNLDFAFGENHMPDFEVPEGYTIPSYLAALCERGLKERYDEITPELRKRLDYELGVIGGMGYEGYFLIVWDFINYARENGILVGPGRGSAAGSIVAYTLGITDIDPIKYDLIFERFLNPERVTMPDIDIDFCYERRSEVIDYVARRYGSEKVGQIVTFGTMAAKGAIRDVGRVLDVPLYVVDKIAKMVPDELGITLEKAVETSPELHDAMAEDPLMDELVRTAMKVEGMPRHCGVHAAGVVISKEPLDKYLPLQRTSDGFVSTQFAKEEVEEAGLLKMDFLGLRTLTVIDNAVNMIRENRGIDFDINRISIDDGKTYEFLSSGETVGVFQLESGGMRELLRSMKPEVFEDIIALIALYRPGPLNRGMDKEFVDRKHGRHSITYQHEVLMPILKNTYGVILYQEQVMRIASDMAGFTLGEADQLRRAMGKKKPQIIAGMKIDFLNGAEKNGIDRKTAEEVFDLVESFAAYGFNKSHSAAYALISYQTAYLKAHYPVELLAATLSSVMETKNKVPFFIREAVNQGIDVMPPDVNSSREKFTASGDSIVFGLTAVKGVGQSAVESILVARDAEGPFKSLQDFCCRVDLKTVSRKVVENLISCGAFSTIHKSRSQLLAIYEKTYERAQVYQRNKNSSQISLFDVSADNGFEEELQELPYPTDRPELSRRERLRMEKDLLGFYVSGHPLQDYHKYIGRKVKDYAEDFTDDSANGKKVFMGGFFSSVQKKVTKNGDQMAIAVLEDLTDEIEVVFFPKAYRKLSALIQEEKMVFIRGRVNVKTLYDESRAFSVIADDLEEITSDHAETDENDDSGTWQRKSSPKKSRGGTVEKTGERVILFLESVNCPVEELEKIREVLVGNSGPVPVCIYFSRERKALACHNCYSVDWGIKIRDELEGINCIENVKYCNT